MYRRKPVGRADSREHSAELLTTWLANKSLACKTRETEADRQIDGQTDR